MGPGSAAMLLLAAWGAQALAVTLLCLWTLALLRRRQPWPETPWPSVLVLVPVRGPQPDLEDFLSGLAAQDLAGPSRVAFAVESAADPAHAVLRRFVAARPGQASLVVAGPAEGRGQRCRTCSPRWSPRAGPGMPLW